MGVLKKKLTFAGERQITGVLRLVPFVKCSPVGGLLLLGILLLNIAVADARQVFRIEPSSPDLIGETALTTTVQSDTLSDLARAYDQGYQEMRLANPTVDPWLPGDGTEVVIPGRYIIPRAPRDGLIVNVPEMRLYFFSRNGEVATFPISIGRQDWGTPKGRTQIVAKVKDPSWYPPQSIREEHAAEGDPLPRVVPAGPDNPLGQFALRLSLDGYLIHGTNKPYGIGMRVTHGCVRMYPKDIESLFKLVDVGAPVHIVNQPYKAALADGVVYLEVHPHLDEDGHAFRDEYALVVRLLEKWSTENEIQLSWREIRRALRDASGVPAPIGRATPRLTRSG